ncbi:MAG: cysteine synthase family protein [Anaerolineales bacterium]|nr:MAG: cysteine synthase family protein [Anaerolineales bacterium]
MSETSIKKLQEALTQNYIDLIGNTPVAEIQHMNPNPNVRIFAKLEGFNPGGSVKDRICKSMIEAAEREGLLGPNTDRILFEPTSGNTGIGLAMIAAARGYEFIAVMPETASVERRKMMAAFGAKFILTDGVKGTNWAIEVAHRLHKEHDRYLMLDQFNNPANPQVHYETTAPEILHDVPQITHFVAGMGTGGTLMGVHRYMQEHKPDVAIVGLEPVAGSKIQGLRNMEVYVPSIYHEELLDDKIILNDPSAFEVARDLAKIEGLFVGISSGAAMWGAMGLAERIKEGTIVVIFPDGGEKYMTTPLFDLPLESMLDEIL